MTVAHPIRRAWISTGGTGAQNYDEFADDAEITAIIADNPASALAVEMPHRAPENVGKSFRDSLPDAVARLERAKSDGHYRPAGDVVVLYRITAPDGTRAYGLWCMVDTDQISASADEPGLVIRNEDVFIDKVRERVALAEATGHLLSPVLLLQTGHGARLHAALAQATADGRPPGGDRPGSVRPHARDLAGRIGDAPGPVAGAGRRRRTRRRRRQPPQPGRADRRPAALPRGGHDAGVGHHPALQPPGIGADCPDRRRRADSGPPRGADRGRVRSAVHERRAGLTLPIGADRGRTRRRQPRPRARRAAAPRRRPRASTPATSASRTSVATIPPRGCATRSTPVGPTSRCSSRRSPWTTSSRSTWRGRRCPARAPGSPPRRAPVLWWPTSGPDPLLRHCGVCASTWDQTMRATS